MIKIAGIAFCILVCSVLLRDKNKPFAIAVAVFGGCLLLFTVSGEIEQIGTELTKLTKQMSSAMPYIKLMMKVLAITLIAQFLSDLCRDNGESAIATVVSSAAEYNADDYSEYLKQFDTSSFTDVLSKDTRTVLKELGIDDFNYESIGSLSFEDFFDIVKNIIYSQIKSPLKGAASLIAFIIISSFISSVKVDDESINGAYSTFSAVVISIILIYQISDTISVATASLKIASDYIYAFVPVFAMILVTSGSTAAAASTNTLLLLLAQGLSVISANVLMPVVNCFLALGICSGLRQELNLHKLLTGLKNIITKSIAVLSGAFVSILSLKTTVASKADILGIRSVRFVINSVVPVIGSTISEGLLSIQSYSSLIKSTVGVVGIIAIVLTFLPSIIQIVLWRIVFGCCETVSDIFNDTSVSATLKAFKDTMLLINVIIILSMVTTIISFGILIAARGAS